MQRERNGKPNLFGFLAPLAGVLGVFIALIRSPSLVSQLPTVASLVVWFVLAGLVYVFAPSFVAGSRYIEIPFFLFVLFPFMWLLYILGSFGFLGTVPLGSYLLIVLLSAVGGLLVVNTFSFQRKDLSLVATRLRSLIQKIRTFFQRKPKERN